MTKLPLQGPTEGHVIILLLLQLRASSGMRVQLNISGG